MSRRKDQALRGLSDKDLLELADSISEKPVDSRVSRNELLKIVRESLSSEEIERIVKESRHPEAGVFSSTRLLKASIVILFGDFVLEYIAIWNYRIVYPYPSYFMAMLNVDIVKLVGLAMMTYWFFSSALRASAINRATAAILSLGGAILIAAILISLTIMAALPYYSPFF